MKTQESDGLQQKNEIRRNTKIWNDIMDNKLICTVNSFGKEKICWNTVAEKLNMNRKQCYSRYSRIKPGIIRGKWTKEEDKVVLTKVREIGKQWAILAKILTNRTGKQIRDRYYNYLDKQVRKKKFCPTEDEKIIKLFNLHGPKWSLIARGFKGRTGDSIKNRFYGNLWNYIKLDKSNKNIPDYLIETLKKKKGEKLSKAKTNKTTNSVDTTEALEIDKKSSIDEVSQNVMVPTVKNDVIKNQLYINSELNELSEHQVIYNAAVEVFNACIAMQDSSTDESKFMICCSFVDFLGRKIEECKANSAKICTLKGI